jgi:D-xylose 1-dehydrogenase (NADP+, D-xylono-1,5-lactone-forming)
MPKSKLKWGIAGLGRFAEHTFIPTVSLFRRSVVKSVFSNDINRAKHISDKFGINNKYNNYDEFLNSDINTVYISSANSFHYEQVIKAARARKNILCEKPLSVNSSQAKEMVQICKENNIFLAVDYLYRFHPQIIKTKELIDNKLLGKIINITLNFNIDLPPSDNYRHNKELSGGGALRDLGTHLIDTLRFLGGEFDIMGGTVDSMIYKGGVDDFASALVKFNNSGYGYFSCSYNSQKAFNRIEILGHKGAISIDSFIGAKHAPSKLTIMLEGEAKRTFRKRGNKLYYLLKSVQKSFLLNEEPLVTGYDGYLNLKLMEELESKCL